MKSTTATKSRSVASRRPESNTQAIAHHTVMGKYKDVGFCSLCAAHAAWAHQLGWSSAYQVGECCQGRSLPAYSAGQHMAERWVNGPAEAPLPPCRIRPDGHGAYVIGRTGSDLSEHLHTGAATGLHRQDDSCLGDLKGIPSGSLVERVTEAISGTVESVSKGDRVRTNTPRSPRFHNRVGTVVGLNSGEVGLSFADSGRITGKTRVDAWFKVAELAPERNGKNDDE